MLDEYLNLFEWEVFMRQRLGGLIIFYSVKQSCQVCQINEAYVRKEGLYVLLGRVIIHNKVAFTGFQACIAASTSAGRSNLFYICIHKLLSNCLLLLYSPPTQSISSQFMYALLHHSSSIQTLTHNATPEISPIDHDPSHLVLTPITTGLIRQEIQDFMEDFILDGGNGYLFETQNKNKRKKHKKLGNSDKYGLSLFKIDCQLEHIFEDSCQESELNSCSSSNSESDISQSFNDECFGNSNTFMSCWSNKLKSKDTQQNDNQEEKQMAIDILNAEYSEKIERFKKHPKAELIKKIKEIEAGNDAADDIEKRALIKKVIEKYVLDYESYCFEQAWTELPPALNDATATIIKGLSDTFAKKVGPISYEARRVKLLTYLEKKKRRKWRKKVSYDCRKRVADGRLRIKGKFVTREQICEQLGFENLDNYTAEEIKEMLERKLDDSVMQQVIC